MHEQIEPGFMVFLSDGDEGIGSVREAGHGLPDLLICIENVCIGNAGDFLGPRSAVAAVHSGEVILDAAHLGLRAREALANARDSEDPSCTAPAADANE